MSQPSSSHTHTRTGTDTHTGPAAAIAGTALTAAFLLAACGSNGSSSSGGLYGNAPAGSSTSASSTPPSRSYTAGGRYGNPPARAGGSSSTPGGAPTTAGSRFGTILVTPQRMTMYAFAIDTRGQSHCTGSCATYWPPVPATDAPKHAVPGITATFGSITRSDGTKQLTVDGFPMYTYAADRSPGDVNGQGVNASGGLWWAVSPNGSWDTRK